MRIFAFWSLLLLINSDLLAQDFYGTGIQEVRLEINDTRWEQRLDSLKRANPEARIIGTMWVNGSRFDSVGIRFKGNSSYFRTRKETLRKLPFNIKTDFKIKGQKMKEGANSVRLSNAFLDPTFVRDPLGYEVVSKYMPAPRCNFVRLTVNNKPFGVYVNSEGIDYNFIKKHFGYSGGHIVKCDPDQWQKVRSQSGCPKGENASLIYLNDSPGCYDAFYEVDDPAAWNELLNLIKILNKKPEQIETVLHVDQALWMLALNNAMVNLDSYNGALSHNYFLWFDSTGVAHPLIWDLNMAFGGWRRNMSFEEMSDEQLIQYQPLADVDNNKRPLIAKLLRDPYYRKLYLAHLRTINNDWLVNQQLSNRASTYMNGIEQAVRQDTMKLYTYDHFKNGLDQTMSNGPDKIIGIRQLMSKRGDFLSAHALLNKVQPILAQPGATVVGDSVLLTVKLDNATGGYAYYRRDRMFAFTRVALSDSGLHGDIQASDGLWSAKVPADKAKQYYFAAENADAAATLPERASWEYFKR
jgi:CotH kinase protein